MITVRDVQDAVCNHFGLSRAEMLEQNRERKFAKPRQIAMFLAREITGESLPRLGMQFCRDHTTVMHAGWAQEKIESDPKWAPEVEIIRDALTNPREAARRQYELHMRKVWKASVPFHLTQEWASMHTPEGH